MTNQPPTWEVDLDVDGPITLRRDFNTRQQKGFRPTDPFYSDIQIRSIPAGLQATVTARAVDRNLAFEAAVSFFGRMLDVLAFIIDQPMYLSFTAKPRPGGGSSRPGTRRVIEREEIDKAFQEALYLREKRPAFLKSLGWYRKGLYTEDPFDRFLAFWNAIEIVAAQYYQNVPSIDKERAKKGSKSQIWECFKAVWGPCETWPIIPKQVNWVDENYDIRIDVAHGVRSIDIEQVAKVSARLTTIRHVARRFLQDWRTELLDLDDSQPLKIVPESGDQLQVE